MKQANPGQRGLLRRFLRERVSPYYGLQAEIAVCLIINVFLNLIDPLILRSIIDRAIGDGNYSLLIKLLSMLLGVLVFRTGFRLISVWLYSYSGLRILFDFRRQAFSSTSNASPPSRSTGSPATRAWPHPPA